MSLKLEPGKKVLYPLSLTMEATLGEDMKNSGWLSDSDMTEVQSVSVKHSTSLHASIT
jgi:hypothetical protein